MRLVRRFGRFVWGLSPRRTDLWDFRTYDRPWSSRSALADWLGAWHIAWMSSDPDWDVAAWLRGQR